MKIAFVHDWNVNFQQELDWQDGLSAALRELENRGHIVHRIVCGTNDSFVPNPLGDIYVRRDIVAEVNKFQPDVILHWADMTRPNARPLSELGIPMAICFAGGEPLGENYPFFQHIFVESVVYKRVFDEADMPCSIAFGTNTDLFRPIEQNKVFDTIFPATFAAWKRHDLYASATRGLKSVACGYMYDTHEQECWQECLRMGTTILPHTSAEVLHYLYAASRVCVVTSLSSGGSQRTVLEAMAMNLPLIITDSDKFDYAQGKAYVCEPDAQTIRGYIDAIIDGEGEANTRDYILQNWSHIQYADALEKGLESICA